MFVVISMARWCGLSRGNLLSVLRSIRLALTMILLAEKILLFSACKKLPFGLFAIMKRKVCEVAIIDANKKQKLARSISTGDLVRRRGNALFRHGFGYRPLETVRLEFPGVKREPSFVLCFVVRIPNDKKIKHLKRLSGVCSLEFKDSVGRICVVVHWTDHGRAGDVLNALLAVKISFRTATRLGVYFNSREIPTYTSELEEAIGLNQFLHFHRDSADAVNGKTSCHCAWCNKHYHGVVCDDGRENEDDYRVLFGDDEPWNNRFHGDKVAFEEVTRAMLMPWNWKSDLGQKFCRVMRQRMKLLPLGKNSALNHLNSPLFRGCDMATLANEA